MSMFYSQSKQVKILEGLLKNKNNGYFLNS